MTLLDSTIKHDRGGFGCTERTADPDRSKMKAYFDKALKTKEEERVYLAVHDSEHNIIYEGVHLLARYTHIDSDANEITYIQFERRDLQPGRCFVAIKMENIQSLQILY